MENILKTEISDDEDITILMRFPCWIFVKIYRLLLHALQIPTSWCERKTFDSFSQNETTDFKFHLGNVDKAFHWQVKVMITNYSEE